MGLPVVYTTKSVHQHKNFPQLWRLDPRVADWNSLCRGDGSTYTLAYAMTATGRELLDERNERLMGATTHAERKAIYDDICERAKVIDYTQPI